MRIAGKVLSLILLIGLLSLSTAMAQDDMMDLDALLDDIGSISEEPSSSEGDSLPLVEEDVAVIQEDDAGADSGEGVFDDDFSLDDLLMDIPEEVADEPAGFENDADADDVSAMDDAMMLDVKQEDVSDEVSLDDLLGVTEDKSVSPSTDADDWSDHVEEVVSEPVEEIPPAEVIYPGVVGVESVDEQVAQDPVAEEQTLSDEDKKKAEKKQRAAERRRMRREAKLLAQQELVRLQAIEAAAVQQVEEGYAALTAGENPAAIDYFTAALERLPEGAKTEDARLRAEWGLAEADYQLALTIYNRKGDIEKARKLIDESIALRPDFRPATKLSSKIEREERRRTLPIPPADLPEIKEQREEVANLLREGSGYYQIGEYDKAEALFERVLLEDEYNTTAMRYLKRIGDRKYKRSSLERDATVARMMGDVRNAWNPPIIEEVELPDTVIGRGVVETKTATQRLQEKMEAIIIPAIEFRQANINDVVNFLVDASIAGDPEGSGVNIILNLSVPGMVPVASEPAPDMGTGGDIWGAEFGSDLFESDFQEEAPAMDVPANTRGIKTITLNLRRISLMDAIKYITEVAALKYRIEDNAVIITPAGVVSGRVITRMYPVQPSILDVIVEKEEPAQGVGEFTELGSGTVIKRSDVKEFFEKAGVPFPVGTSITYNQSISQLIVANTPDNLEIFERILAQLNVIPNQVEIEARFVEVSQTDLEEMGLEWILTDNWEIMSKNGNYPAGGREQIQMNADNSGITKGLRFFNVNTENRSIGPASTASALPVQKMLGGIMSFSSVLTNPELSIVLHALSQSGGADLLSAPRVTTRSGQNAIIQVVREIIYPTEFDTTQPQFNENGNITTPPVVTPGSFQTRPTGVILEVTPTVGPDGYTIDLVLQPEVAELVDWLQYGSVVQLSQTQSFTFNIPQPVFRSRKVTTSIVIWDGQTVVMGGLIREDLVTIKDKVPILGDIPLLGRLFRNEGEYSQKENLLIFVTARLVDPSGKPIHKAEVMAMPGGGVPGASDAVAN